MTNKVNKHLNILISSCDAYSDLWKLTLDFLKKNFDDKSIPIKLLTDKPTDIAFEGTEIIFPPAETDYSSRLKYALQLIESEFILFTLDDYFLIKKVDLNSFNRVVEQMKNEQIDYVRFFSYPNSFKKYSKTNRLYKISLKNDYDLNFYPGIWRKSYLLSLIEEGLNIWSLEVSLTRKARTISGLNVICKKKNFIILDVIRKGKVLHKAKKFLRKKEIVLTNRQTITYREEFRIFVMTVGKRFLPKPFHGFIKKILNKVGYDFYSD